MENVESLERDMTAKRVYVRDCAGSCSMGKSRKRWIDTVKDCLEKNGLYIRQARKMVQDRSEWRGVYERNA